MADFYSSMTELYTCEPSTSYAVKIRTIDNESRMVVAPHGGSIEVGTSELAFGIAGGVYDTNTKWNYFVFEGSRSSGENGVLHVTSANYDDTALITLIGKMSKAVSIHGCQNTVGGQTGGSEIAWCGGLNVQMRDAIINELVGAGFDARVATDSSVTGTDPNNFVNRTSTNAGVQLELTTALRSSFYGTNTAAGRATSQTPAFWSFCGAVRNGMV